MVITTVTARPNPYVGPRSFKRGETIYGRERETSELVDLLIAERIVLLYSPSGAGKSSLLNAAILPRMEDQGFKLLPVMRVNQEPPTDVALPQDFNRYVYSLILSIESTQSEQVRFSAEELVALRFKDYLEKYRGREHELNSDYNDPPLLLVFDQAEEVVTLLLTDRDVKADFFAQVGEALRDRNLWALFAAREDYLASFDPYLRPVPTRLSTRYRLNLLEVDAALQAIERPAETRDVKFARGAALKLVDDLRRVHVQQPDGTTVEEPGPFIEPVQLQVVCRRLWAELSHDTTEISREEVESIGNVDQALAAYYSLQVASAASSAGISERSVREWFDRKLITVNGIRGQVLLAPQESDGLSNDAIWHLEKAYLVRAEKRGGATWFELAHDRLIQPIRQDNASWFENNLSFLQRQADLWNRQGRPESMLVTGVDFIKITDWYKAHKSEMTDVEQDFYAASLKAHQAAIREHRTNILVRWLFVASLLTTVIAVIFFFRAQITGLRAVARELAADSLSTLSVDPQLSVLLALSSQNVTGDLNIENTRALHRALPDMRLEDAFTGTQQNGHTDRVYAVAFSPDGTELASVGRDGTLRVWNVAAKKLLVKEVVVSQPRSFGVTNLAYSPDGKSLAVSTELGQIVVYSTSNWNVLKTIVAAKKDVIWSVAYSPDGKYLASASGDHTSKIWDAKTYDLLFTLGVEGCTSTSSCGDGDTGPVNAVAFSPNSKYLATGGSDAVVRVWDPSTGKLLVEFSGENGHHGPIEGLAFSPDNLHLASSSNDRTIRIWSMESKSWEMTINGHTDWVYGITYTQDGSELISASADRTIRIWDTTYGRLETTLTGDSDQVFDVSLSPDGKYLASASADKSVRIWNISASGSREIMTLNSGPVGSVAVSPDGAWIASTDQSGQEIDLWDAATGKLVRKISATTEGGLQKVAWGPDSKWLVSVGLDGTPTVWNATTGAPLQTFGSSTNSYTAVAVSPDGKEIASSSDGKIGDRTIYIWDPSTGKQIQQLTASKLDRIFDVAFSPDGKWLAAAYEQETVLVWDVASGKIIHTYTGHTDYVEGVSFSPNGKVLASVGDDGNLILWNVEASDDSKAMLSSIAAHNGSAYRVRFSQDGQTLVTAGGDALVRAWDVSDDQAPYLLYTLYGHTDSVTSLSMDFSRDHVVSGSGDGTIRVFTMNTDELIQQAQSRLTREMTDNECETFLYTSCENFQGNNLLNDLTIWIAGVFHAEL